MTGTHYTCGNPPSPWPGARVRPARPPCCPRRRPSPSASSVRMPSTPWSTVFPTPWSAHCRRGAHGRPARRPVRPARPPGPGPAAAWLLDFGGPARPVPRHRARGRMLIAAGSPAPRRGGHRPGRLVGAAPGPAAGRPGTRHLPGQRGPLFLAHWPPGPGRVRYGRALSGCGLAMATVGSYLGGHLALRLGAGASHADQVSHLAGLGWHDLCGLTSCPTGARSAASSATCPCWCTGRAAR